MRTHTWLIVCVLLAFAAPEARSQPRKTKPATATKADIDRLEKRIEEQQKQLEKLTKLQQQYLQSLRGMFDTPVTDVKPADVKPEPVTPPAPQPKAEAKPDPKSTPVDKAAVGFNDAKPAAPERRLAKPKKPEGMGTVVGKITGVPDAIIYIEDIVTTAHGSATMKQEGKQFVPRVLVVQKGTSVQFPNMDAVFHNVFSVTPDQSFDLGSYRQGESKGVTMSKPGVVSVYCNMHPQMVGHILVVPNGNYVQAGKDGFFRLTNVPAGKHRVVAWAPNAKPVVADADVSDAEVVTVELELKKGHSTPHTKKDGLPYGSYAE
jgi:plastocyanin